MNSRLKNCPDETIYGAAEDIRRHLRRLTLVYRDIRTLTAGPGNRSGISSEATLFKAARDVMVAYTHFLAELMNATAAPWTIIDNGAVCDENKQWHITFHCNLDLPETEDELTRWQPTGLAYDQSLVNLVLQRSLGGGAGRDAITLTADTTASFSPAPSKGLSFWEVIGIAGLLSLFTGCDHDG